MLSTRPTHGGGDPRQAQQFPLSIFRGFNRCAGMLRRHKKKKKIQHAYLVKAVEAIVHLLPQKLGAVALACEALAPPLGRRSALREKQPQSIMQCSRRGHLVRKTKTSRCSYAFRAYTDTLHAQLVHEMLQGGVSYNPDTYPR